MPAEVKAPALLTPEIFVEKKRCDASFRDLSCKAVCAIKRGLREPGAQADGKPVIPANWEEKFKPLLGPYLKFLLTRSDQFRVIEGAERGLYTVENITMNRIVEAPTWEQIKGSKGKAKGKGKGKELDGVKGKGKGKGKDTSKTKARKGYLGRQWETKEEEDEEDEAATQPRKRVMAMGLSRRKVEETEETVAEDDEMEFEVDVEPEPENEELAAAEEPAPAENGHTKVEEFEEEVVDEDMEIAVDAEDDVQESSEVPSQEAHDQVWSPAVSGHGSYIKSLLGGGFFSKRNPEWAQ